MFRNPNPLIFKLLLLRPLSTFCLTWSGPTPPTHLPNGCWLVEIRCWSLRAMVSCIPLKFEDVGFLEQHGLFAFEIIYCGFLSFELIYCGLLAFEISYCGSSTFERGSSTFELSYCGFSAFKMSYCGFLAYVLRYCCFLVLLTEWYSFWLVEWVSMMVFFLGCTMWIFYV